MMKLEDRVGEFPLPGEFFRMKKLLFIALLILSCRPTPTLQTKENTPWLEDQPQAFSQSQQTQTPLLIEVAAEWCPSCKFIDERIFSQEKVAERLKNFILLRVDGDLASNQKFMEERHVRWYPTFLILNPEGKEESRFSEVISSDDLIENLDGVSNAKLGFKELGEARLAEENEEKEKGIKLYEKAAELFRSQNHPALEEALVGLVRLTIEEEPLFLDELLRTFPKAVAIPEFYKKLADRSASETLKKNYFLRAQAILEERLNKQEPDDFSAEQIAIDADLLADIYKELGRHNEILKIYRREAKKLEAFMKKTGGATHNRHLISNIVYLYREAGESKKALGFLEEVQKELPTYWPVYQSFAKVYQDLGEFEKGVQSASRAYDLAMEVAKSRCALVWADCEAGRKNYKEAVAVLGKGVSDLKTLTQQGQTPQGRAKKMLAKLEERIEEFQRNQKLLP